MSKLPQDIVTEGSVDLLGKVDGIDMGTFNQILEMDEPDDPFSSVLVYDFFEQVETTFKDMDTAIESKDLRKLSDLGHYLKGSSATLGLIKLRDACEKIQRFGKQEHEDGTPGLEEDECVTLIEDILEAVKEDFEVVKVALTNFYGDKP